MFILLHLSISFYYAISITYMYSRILTPRMRPRKTFYFSLFFIFAVVSLHIFHYYASFAGILILTGTLLANLLFYKDSLFKKAACFIMVYITQLLFEAISYLLTGFAYYLYTGKSYSSNAFYSGPEWTAYAMSLFIFFCAAVFLPPLTQFYRKWIYHRLTPVLILISLPLIIPVCTTFLGDFALVSTYPVFVLCFCIIVYILSYIPAYFGLRKLYRQAQEYYLAQNEYALIEQQMAFSNEIEAQFTEIRKWNHDLNNHLVSLSFLFKEERYSQAQEYLKSLLDIDTDEKL